MPNRDGKGPAGNRRTGRGLGDCAKSSPKPSETKVAKKRRTAETGTASSSAKAKPANKETKKKKG